MGHEKGYLLLKLHISWEVQGLFTTYTYFQKFLLQKREKFGQEKLKRRVSFI